VPDKVDHQIVRRDDNVNPIVDWYAHNPILRGLVGLVPYAGSGLDTAVVTAYANVQRRRIETFFEALATGGIELTDEIIQSDEFLHRFMITARAVTAQGQAEKIKLFANLLRNGFDSGALSTAEYEELLRILDSLSVRELRVLEMMEQRLRTVPVERGRPTPLPTESWDRIIDDIASALGVSRQELAAMLSRVQRTGCYMENQTTTWGYGGPGYTTALWQKVRNFILGSSKGT
jgi:hypothetical protein